MWVQDAAAAAGYPDGQLSLNEIFNKQGGGEGEGEGEGRAMQYARRQ